MHDINIMPNHVGTPIKKIVTLENLRCVLEPNIGVKRIINCFKVINSVYKSFIKFRNQNSRNVHDVRKLVQ